MACGYGINAHSSELKAATLDKGHVEDLIEEANKHRRLLGMKKEGSLQDTLPLPCRMRHAVHVCRWLERWQQPHTPPVPGQPKRGKRRGVGPRTLTCPPPFTLTPMARVGVHVIKVDSRVLQGVCRQLGLTKETRAAFTSEPALSHHWARWFNTNKLRNKEFHFERLVDTDGVSVCMHYTRPLPPPPAPPPPAASSSSTSSRPSAAAAAAHAVGLPHIGRGIAEVREFVFDPDTQIGVGIDPGVTQAVSAASGVWDPATGQLKADQLRRWKLTKGEVKHASGLNNARRDTQRWLAPIKPHLQHLAAASSAGTSLEANLKHITVTLATWDAVWEVYLDPKWARQRLRLYGAQDRALEQFFNKLEEGMEELSMKRHGHAKQLVVFFGAATIGTAGGWGADAVLRACRKVVCRPRGKDQDGGRVVLVDEHRTSRVSSAVNGQQPCEVELNTLSATRPAGWRPPAGQVEERLVRPAWSQERGQPVRGLVWCPVVAPRRPPQAPRSSQAATLTAASEPGPSTPQPAKRSKRTKAEPGAAEPTKGKAQGKAAKAKPAPQPGRWLDRDCNAALNMQRIGESRWRPLELCFWPDQGALPAKGKEYPGLGYKRLRDKPPKAQEQQQQPAEAHWCHFMDCSPDKDLAPRACSAAGQARQTRPPELDNVAPREARGLDYLASPTGVIAQAQAAAAAAFGAEQTWFLVNGCSVAIHAEVLAVAGSGDALLLARNCHQAAYAAVTLAELATVCHEAGIPLLVDEAHGGQYGLLPDPQVAAGLFTHPCIFHGKPKLLEDATARRTAHRVMAKKKRKGSDKKRRASRSAQGKQRQARRDGWATRQRQVIKVPEGAVLRGCKKTRRKLREHLRLRAEIHSQLRFIASLFVLRIFLTCLVGYPTPGSPSAPQPPAVQPPQPPDAPPLPPLPPRAPAQPAQPAQPASMECDSDSDSESDCDSDPEPQSDSESESESEPEPVAQPPQRRCSARLAAMAPAAPTGPPLPLDCEDPLMLRQLKDFCKFFANPNFKTCYNQLQRRLVRNRHPMLMPAFEDPSNQALLAKLQELGSTKLTGFHNTIDAHSMQLAVAMQQHYSNPGKPPQAPRSSQAATQAAASEPGPSTPQPAKRSKRTKAEPGAAEPTKGKGKGKAAKAKPAPQPGRWLDRDCNAALNMQRIGESRWRPLELCFWPDQGALPAKGKEYPGLGYKRLRDKPPKAQEQQPAEAHITLATWIRSARSREEYLHPKWAEQMTGWYGAQEGVLGRFCTQMAPGLADERAFLFDPATQVGMGLNPGAIQAVSAASGVWRADGRLQGFYRSKLTRSQVQHDSGLIQARRNTQRWNENVKLELQHLAAATPAGTSLVAIQRHVAVTLATWDAVWGECLHPKWAEQRMRLHGAQEMVVERYFKKLEEEAASVSQQEWGARKQLVVFFGNAGIGTRGGWGAKAVLQACRKVMERPNSGKPTARQPGNVVTEDEIRTSQATPGDLGKWVDRDCNAALNLQRAGESKWRPLELCRWPHRGRLPAQGKEYPALGFKKLRDRAPKATAQQPVAQ
ncbi:hypothetical protein QJQ45_003359 [Haematococcus lacustris]|nr:hypothetical protein QJQ45_003359 [Haematococcus lacustris]